MNMCGNCDTARRHKKGIMNMFFPTALHRVADELDRAFHNAAKPLPAYVTVHRYEDKVLVGCQMPNAEWVGAWASYADTELRHTHPEPGVTTTETTWKLTPEIEITFYDGSVYQPKPASAGKHTKTGE